MDIEKIERASKLLEELRELEKYKDLLVDDRKNETHFQFVQHYGKLETYSIVNIPNRYNNRFLELLDGIIVEMKFTIDNL